jgi:hypothetical protein
MGSADVLSLLEGEMAAQRPEGVASATRRLRDAAMVQEVPSEATLSARFAGTSPSSGAGTP